MNHLKKIAISLSFALSFVEMVSSMDRRDLYEILSDVTPHAAPRPPVDVNFSLDFLCFLFDPETRKLQTVVEERYLWLDPRLAWVNHPNRMLILDNAINITASSALLWTPDIKLYNRIKLSDKDEQVMARIFYNGTVAWFLLAIHYTLCSRDEKEVLLDDRKLFVARCRLKFASWTHLKDEVFLTSMEGGFHNLKHYDGNCAKVNSINSYSVETYSSTMVYYDLELILREVAMETETPPLHPRSTPHLKRCRK